MKTQRIGDQKKVVYVTPRCNDLHSPLDQPFSTISEFCNRLVLPEPVKHLSQELFAKTHSFKISTKHDDSVEAACVFIAARKENQSRTLKEMRMATGLSEKRITAIKNIIVKKETVQSMELEIQTRGSDYLRRFSYTAGLNFRGVKAAQEIYEKSKELDLRRSPISIAAGIVFLTSHLCGNEISAKDISIVTSVSEATVRKSYKDLHPHLWRIVPSWLATEDNLRMLPKP